MSGISDLFRLSRPLTPKVSSSSLSLVSGKKSNRCGQPSTSTFTSNGYAIISSASRPGSTVVETNSTSSSTNDDTHPSLRGGIASASSANNEEEKHSESQATKTTLNTLSNAFIEGAARRANKFRQDHAGSLYNATLQKIKGLSLKKTSPSSSQHVDREAGNDHGLIDFNWDAIKARPNFKQVPAEEFLLFPMLPQELRLRIIALQLRKGRLVEVHCPIPPWPLSIPDVIVSKGIWARPSPLLSVNHMFRQECLKFYQRPLIFMKGNDEVPSSIYFSPGFDALLMPKALLNLDSTFKIGGLHKIQHLILLCTPEDAYQAANSRVVRRDYLMRIVAVQNRKTLKFRLGFVLDLKGHRRRNRISEVEIVTRKDRARGSRAAKEFWGICGPMFSGLRAYKVHELQLKEYFYECCQLYELKRSPASYPLRKPATLMDKVKTRINYMPLIAKSQLGGSRTGRRR